MPISYKSHAFDISYSRPEAGAHDFLTSIGPHRRRHIREIRFNYYGHTAAATFRLLATMESLDCLRIVDLPWHWMVFEWKETTARYDFRGWDELLELRGLRRVIVETDDGYHAWHRTRLIVPYLVGVLRPRGAVAEGREEEDIKDIEFVVTIDDKNISVSRR